MKMMMIARYKKDTGLTHHPPHPFVGLVRVKLGVLVVEEANKCSVTWHGVKNQTTSWLINL